MRTVIFLAKLPQLVSAQPSAFLTFPLFNYQILSLQSQLCFSSRCKQIQKATCRPILACDCATARITSLPSKDWAQAACHFVQQQLQNRQFTAALFHAARSCSVQTGTVTDTCSALLLFILRTEHSASVKIF